MSYYSRTGAALKSGDLPSDHHQTVKSLRHRCCIGVCFYLTSIILYELLIKGCSNICCYFFLVLPNINPVTHLLGIYVFTAPLKSGWQHNVGDHLQNSEMLPLEILIGKL